MVSQTRGPGAGVRYPDVVPVTAGGELDTVNRVVAEALLTWDLPKRVQRLALPSLLYNTADLDHMSIGLAEQPEIGGVAVAAWEEADNRDAPLRSRSVLLHGLYVTPAWQHQGLGTNLLELAKHWTSARGFDCILVCAWRESEAFFRARGFDYLDRAESPDRYPRRMWMALQ